MIGKDSLQLFLSKICHEKFAYIVILVRLLNQVMHLVKPLAIFVIQVQQIVFSLIDLMNQ